MPRRNQNRRSIVPTLIAIVLRLRHELIPRRTGRYLIAEGSSIALLTIVAAYVLDFPLVVGGITAASIVLVPIMRLLALDPNQRDTPHAVLNIPSLDILVSTLFSIIPFILLIVYSPFLLDEIILLTVQLLYVFRLENRASLYRDEREFYTDEESNASASWVRASAALEQAIENYNSDNLFLSFYWSEIARKSYQTVIENESRAMPRAAANELGTAAYFLSIASATTSRNAAKFRQAVKRAREKSRQADRQNNQESRARNQSETNKQSQQYHKKRDISFDKACAILNLSQPINSNKDVHDAYRSIVTEVHPDVGGSAEEFKKVKKARDKLAREVTD